MERGEMVDRGGGGGLAESRGLPARGEGARDSLGGEESPSVFAKSPCAPRA